MTSAPPRGVLLIGAGYRIQNSFLPVLSILRDDFKIVGIHSRTAMRRQPLAELWDIPSVTNLNGPELAAADVVAISVPIKENITVLRALLPHAARLHLVVDTPGAIGLRPIAAIAPLFAKFASVTFTEDHMTFPIYALLRKAVAQGLIGEPKKLTLFHTGYVYHGLAVIRAFTKFRPVVRSWRRQVGNLTNIVGYRFQGGFEGCIVNPYHANQPDGGFILEGTAGVITEFPTDLSHGSPSRPVYLLRPRHTDGLLTGYAIDAGTKSLELDLPEISLMRQMPIEDKSDHNLRRACGMVNIFRSLSEPDRDAETRLNTAYGWRNALYDSFVSRSAEGGRFPFDPLTLIGKDVMSVLSLVGRLRSLVKGSS